MKSERVFWVFQHTSFTCTVLTEILYRVLVLLHSNEHGFEVNAPVKVIYSTPYSSKQ